MGLRISKNCTIAVQIAPMAKPIRASFDPFTSNLEIRKDNIKLITNAQQTILKVIQIKVPTEIS